MLSFSCSGAIGEDIDAKYLYWSWHFLMWDRQGEVRGLSGCAGQMLRRSFLARAVDLDTRKYAAGERDDRQQEPKTNPIVPTISRNFRRLTSSNLIALYILNLCDHLSGAGRKFWSRDRWWTTRWWTRSPPSQRGRRRYALIQTGKKQRTSDGVRLRLDLETPRGPVCWLTCLWVFSNPIPARPKTSLFLFFNVFNLTTWQFLPHSSHNCLVTSESSSQSRLFQLLSRSPNLLTSRQCHPLQYGPATMCGRNSKVFFFSFSLSWQMALQYQAWLL